MSEFVQLELLAWDLAAAEIALGERLGKRAEALDALADECEGVETIRADALT